MRILLATKIMDMGGIERSVVSLARELTNLGHQVWVVSSGGYLVPELERQGTPHVWAPLEVGWPNKVLQAAQIIRRVIQDERIDLVHSFSATSSLAVSLALRRWPTSSLGRVRLVSSPMGLQNSPRESPVTTWLRNWGLTLGAERILVISPEIRRHLKRVRAPEEALLDFNFVGLDPEAFQAGPDDYASVRAEFGFPPDACLVSTIGKLHPRKSHDLFIEAAALVAARVPDARFLVIGDGELQDLLERHARGRGLADRLVLTGVRDDVARLLAATDVYVKPGIVEGFIGITVLEALALARPVVAFDTEDVKLAVRDGVTGLVARNADTADLAEKIVYLLEHPAEGARLGAAGQRLVAERFHFRTLAERLEQLYQQMVTVPTPALAR